MKKIYAALNFITVLLMHSTCYAIIYPLTYDAVMSEEFGLKEDAISIYDELSIKNRAGLQEGLSAAQEWKDILLKKIDAKNVSIEQRVHLGRELMAVCLVGMYYANQYCAEHNDNNLLNKYADIFMNPLMYAVHALGVFEELNSQTAKNIHNIIYVPVLRDLAAHAQEVNKRLKAGVKK